MRRPAILPLPHDAPEALLGYARADDPDLQALCALAPRLDALFRLLSPAAPALHLIGAAFRCGGARLSATGAGLTERSALAACLGEAAETLAQEPRRGDVVDHASLADPPPDCGLSPDELAEAARRGVDATGRLGWISARRLPDGAPCLLPAPLCLRAPGAAPGLSLGCAAGADAAAAERAALCELAERDALAAGRAAPAPAEATQAATDLLSRVGRPGPAPALWSITRPRRPPAVLIRGPAAQASAAGDAFAEAARAAVREFCAAETGAALSPSAPPPRPVLEPAAAQAGSLCGLVAEQAALGRPLCRVDLGREELGVPVVKLVGFGLAPGQVAA